jgi:hypothetical protein
MSYSDMGLFFAPTSQDGMSETECGRMERQWLLLPSVFIYFLSGDLAGAVDRHLF